MLWHILVIFIVLEASTTTTTTTTASTTTNGPVSSCQDLDTQSCTLLAKAKPDLCTDPSFSQGSCRRFCGNCPISCYDCPGPVHSLSECGVKLCSENQTCMIKQFTPSDGHTEYILRCEYKKLCEGLLEGFYNVPVGKRHIFEREEQFKRHASLSLSCCDTDFCNHPQSTTTSTLTPKTTVIPTITVTATTTGTPIITVTPKTTGTPTKTVTPTTTGTSTIKVTTTTTETPTSPGLFPHGCDRDIVFVLDDSGSVGLSNFRRALEFVRSIIQHLEIGPTKAQIGLITFSTHPQVAWYLNTYGNKSDILHATNRVRYMGGVTHTHDALQTVRTQVLTPARGDRPGVANVVIVFTEGRSNSHMETIEEANKLKQVCADVISIAISRSINVQELNAMATDSHHVFDLRNNTNLGTILTQVMQSICNA